MALDRNNFDALRALMREASAAGVDRATLSAAARALVDLADEPLPVRRAREVLRLKDQRLPRAVICERLGLSRGQYNRALEASREDRDVAAVERLVTTQESVHVDLKSSSIGLGNAIAPMSKYGSAPRPKAPADNTPRDGGGMAIGKTGGNYTEAKVANLQVAPDIAEDCK